jgi:hypothetical protein
MEMPVEKKADKTWAIVGTVAAILLCGLPGLCLFVPLSIAIFAGGFNYNTVGVDLQPAYGVPFLCLSVIFIAIAVLVPVLTLRKKKPAARPVDILPPQDFPPAQPPMPPEPPLPPQPPMPPQEPLPPAS